MTLERDIQRQVINLVAIIAAFITNVLANIKPLDGLTIAEISDQYFEPVLILPAGYAFSIWGLIYVGLISLAVYQALPSQKNNPHTKQLGYWLTFASITQIIWVIFFQYQLFAVSLVVIGLIVVFLAKLYLTLNHDGKAIPQKIRWLVRRPISIYCAWVTVATIVNAACLLHFLNWSGWGIEPEIWAAILLVIGTGLAAFITFKYRDIVFGGVFVWAWVAIAVKHSQTEIVPTVAIAGALILGSLCVATLFMPRRTSLSLDSEN
ncbi:tryptophan-rich sensory protein [[Limnothrix rosea] IAM M-220]|uniref:tryptophan-rich sensory protein n=1 Tax=[Limnothrix rosea] IAM M-220 TaxID=454133 RepID=UPI000968737A|nr:tryptophan-rich sensory protein [[Limnothrix rosea] IAM M-220]OKH19329.1 hypothetical protein NIES208_02085 [[Limnothrix rosea] IAM M-220]